MGPQFCLERGKGMKLPLGIVLWAHSPWESDCQKPNSPQPHICRGSLATFFNLFQHHWLSGDESVNRVRSFNIVLFITRICSILACVTLVGPNASKSDPRFSEHWPGKVVHGSWQRTSRRLQPQHVYTHRLSCRGVMATPCGLCPTAH